MKKQPCRKGQWAKLKQLSIETQTRVDALMSDLNRKRIDAKAAALKMSEATLPVTKYALDLLNELVDLPIFQARAYTPLEIEMFERCAEICVSYGSAVSIRIAGLHPMAFKDTPEFQMLSDITSVLGQYCIAANLNRQFGGASPEVVRSLENRIRSGEVKVVEVNGRPFGIEVPGGIGEAEEARLELAQKLGVDPDDLSVVPVPKDASPEEIRKAIAAELERRFGNDMGLDTTIDIQGNLRKGEA